MPSGGGRRPEMAAPVLSPRQAAFVAALSAGMTQAAAGVAAGVSPRTARRWCADPAVRAAIREATDAMVAAASRRLASGLGAATGVIGRLLADTTLPPSLQLRVAESWLDRAIKAYETADLTERVEKLEAIQNESM